MIYGKHPGNFTYIDTKNDALENVSPASSMVSFWLSNVNFRELFIDLLIFVGAPHRFKFLDRWYTAIFTHATGVRMW